MIRRRRHTNYSLILQLSLAVGTSLINNSNFAVKAFTFANNPSIRPTPIKRISTSSSSSLTQSNMSILESPSAERNKGPIYDTVLSPVILPRLVKSNNNDDSLKVLELAAGCGVHTTHFASSILSSYPAIRLEWTPSDPDNEARSSIDARVAVHEDPILTNVVRKANGWTLGHRGGTACNDGVRDSGGGGSSKSSIEDGGGDATTSSIDYSEYHDYFDLVTCINMIHIAPWEATLGLMECAGQVLRKGGILMCYGPYIVDGKAMESNLKFDASLKSRDSSWGLRHLEKVVEVAKAHGLILDQTIEMPANNLSVLFCKE